MCCKISFGKQREPIEWDALIENKFYLFENSDNKQLKLVLKTGVHAGENGYAQVIHENGETCRVSKKYLKDHYEMLKVLEKEDVSIKVKI